MWRQTKCCKANTYADVNESFKQKRWWWCYIDLQQGLSIGVCHLSIAHTHTWKQKQQSQEWRARVKFRPWKLLSTPTPSISRINFTHAPIQCNSVKRRIVQYENISVLIQIVFKGCCFVVIQIYECLYVYAKIFFIFCYVSRYCSLFFFHIPAISSCHHPQLLLLTFVSSCSYLKLK